MGFIPDFGRLTPLGGVRTCEVRTLPVNPYLTRFFASQEGCEVRSEGGFQNGLWAISRDLNLDLNTIRKYMRDLGQEGQEGTGKPPP